MYDRDSFGDAFGGGMGAIAVVAVVVSVYITIRCVLFVIRIFLKYHDHTSLWISLAVCVALWVVGIVLSTQVDQSFSLLLIIGIAQLLITCLVVDLKNRNTLLRANVNLIDSILKSSWFSEDTPRQEEELEQIAA